MNVADLYRQAFESLSESEFAAYHSLLGRDVAESSALVERGGFSLDLLGKAALRNECDWGFEAALGTPTDDFSGGRRLAVLSILRAERAFRIGNDAKGLDDLVSVMALGRHLGQGKYVSALAGSRPRTWPSPGPSRSSDERSGG
jgi:hypothetical protein